MKDTIDKVNSVKSFAAGDLFLAVALFCGIFLLWPWIGSSVPDEVTVFRDNQIIARYPLNESNTFSVSGDIGPVDIAIRDGRVSIVSVTCPHQICRRFGTIHRSSEQIVCVPNRVLIEIRSTKGKDKFDALTY